MRIGALEYKNTYVYDCETLTEMFYIAFLNEQGGYVEFEISEWKNELYALIKWYNNKNIDFAVGYNNLGFDAQVMEYIIRTHDEWIDLNNIQISEKISLFVQNLIDSQRWKSKLPY